jgi:hypothetical protein
MTVIGYNVLVASVFLWGRASITSSSITVIEYDVLVASGFLWVLLLALLV